MTDASAPAPEETPGTANETGASTTAADSTGGPGASANGATPEAAGGTESAPQDLRGQMARVIQEYLRLDKQLQQVENTNFRVCIFGSARIHRRDPTWQLVYGVAKRLAKRGIDVVTGGGPGLMEAANRAVQDAHDERSKAYGLPLDIPTLREPANKHMDIKSAHQRFSTRLDEFMRLSHAVIVAPGGIGTLLELAYVWQLLQIGLLEKRPVLLLGEGFWDGLLDWMRSCMQERAFIHPEDMDFVQVVTSREEALDVIQEEHERFLRQLEQTMAGQAAPPVTVTVGQPNPLASGAPAVPAPDLTLAADVSGPDTLTPLERNRSND